MMETRDAETNSALQDEENVIPNLFRNLINELCSCLFL